MIEEIAVKAIRLTVGLLEIHLRLEGKAEHVGGDHVVVHAAQHGRVNLQGDLAGSYVQRVLDAGFSLDNGVLVDLAGNGVVQIEVVTDGIGQVEAAEEGNRRLLLLFLFLSYFWLIVTWKSTHLSFCFLNAKKAATNCRLITASFSDDYLFLLYMPIII